MGWSKSVGAPPVRQSPSAAESSKENIVAVKLRLMRMGKKKQPTYRVVAADARSPRNGRFIEIVGTYEPRRDPSVINIDNERAVHWLRHGAQPTERVAKLLKISGAWSDFTGEAPPVAVTTAASAEEPAAEPETAADEAEATTDETEAATAEVEAPAEAAAQEPAEVEDTVAEDATAEDDASEEE
jgi:small subunit ribosomal protein S16